MLISLRQWQNGHGSLLGRPHDGKVQTIFCYHGHHDLKLHHDKRQNFSLSILFDHLNGTDGLGAVLPLSLLSISKSLTSEFVLLLHAHMLYKSKNSSISWSTSSSDSFFCCLFHLCWIWVTFSTEKLAKNLFFFIRRMKSMVKTKMILLKFPKNQTMKSESWPWSQMKT